MVALSKGLLHFTWNDTDQYEELLRVLIGGLQDSDYAEVKPFLTLLQFMVTRPGGEPAEKRLDKTMIPFLQVIENSQTYYKFMETIFEFIFKLVSGVPHMSMWFIQNR